MSSPPKIRFLIDENVRKEVAEFLKLCGHDVLVVSSGAKDEEIARLAKQTKRIILTHDQHFADILTYPPEEYSGIIRIKIHPPTSHAIIKALKDFLPQISRDKLDKKLVILEKEGFRLR
jgi:predicted nuclease of predicted toxin-antitoxin system